jgi:hypothetical protein
LNELPETRPPEAGVVAPRDPAAAPKEWKFPSAILELEAMLDLPPKPALPDLAAIPALPDRADMLPALPDLSNPCQPGEVLRTPRPSEDQAREEPIADDPPRDPP